MAGKQLRLGIVGAGSLFGKEVADEVADSVLGTGELILLDEAAKEGQVTTTGGEATFIQRLDASTLAGLDFLFFAGTPETALKHWQAARTGGATVIDLTGALAGQPTALLWTPWLRAANAGGADGRSGVQPDLNTAALVAPHAASLLLALLALRLSAAGRLRTFAATLLQPASEQGSGGMDELHQQTVSLLSFHDLPRELYDAQTAFNLLAAFGPESRARLEGTEQLILEQMTALAGAAAASFSVQMLQAPVFHGYAASIYVEFEGEASLEAVTGALAGPHVEVTGAEDEAPSNLHAAGRADVQVRVRAAQTAKAAKGFWLWATADNLKLAAANAVASALHMRSLRPQGKVQ